MRKKACCASAAPAEPTAISNAPATAWRLLVLNIIRVSPSGTVKCRPMQPSGIRTCVSSPVPAESRSARRLDGVLLVGDVLEPGHVDAVLVLVQGEVDEPARRRRAMPMLLVRRDPDRVAGADLLDRAVPFLHPPDAGDDVQRLPERMGVPGRARAGLERHPHRLDARRLGSLDDRVLPHGPGEPFAAPAPRRDRNRPGDVHGRPPFGSVIGAKAPPASAGQDILDDGAGWGARIRTWEWLYQKPLPYHLATPHREGGLHSCRAPGWQPRPGDAFGKPSPRLRAPDGAAISAASPETIGYGV